MIDLQAVRKQVEADPAYMPDWRSNLLDLASLAGYASARGWACAEKLAAELVEALRPGVYSRADAFGVTVPDELRARIDSCTDWDQWVPMMSELDAVVDGARNQTD